MKNRIVELLVGMVLLMFGLLIADPYAEPVNPFEQMGGMSFDSLNIRLVGSWPFGPASDIAFDTLRNLAFCGTYGGGVYILEVSDPFSPQKLSEKIHGRGYIRGLFYDYPSQRLFVSDWSYLGIWDISDPLNPIMLGFCNPTGKAAAGLSVSGSYAYVADWEEGVRVIDVSSPSNPIEVGSYEPGYGTQGIATQDSFAYVITIQYPGFRVLDISTPSSPSVIGWLGVPVRMGALFVSDSHAYVTSSVRSDSSYFWIVNISNPILPYGEGFCATTNDSPRNIFSSGKYAYISDYQSLTIVSVDDPMNPQVMSNTIMPCLDTWVNGTYAYIAANAFFNIYTVEDPQNPIAISQYDMPEHAKDIFVAQSYAYLANGFGGLRIIDISILENPVEVGSFKKTLYDDAYGVFASDSIVYIAGGISNYFAAINTADPSNPILVGECYAKNAYSIYVEDSYGYLGCSHTRSTGMAIVDISNPANPYEISWFQTQFAVQDIIVAFPYAYLCAQDLLILDVSDPYSPQQIGIFPTIARGIELQDSLAYLTNGLQGTTSGFQIVNVSNPSLPWEVGCCSTPGRALNCGGNAPYIYVADAGSGLRLIDVSNPAIPIEVGFYEPGGCIDIEFSNNYAFVANGYWGLWIYECLGTGIEEETEKPFPQPAKLQLLQNPASGNYIEVFMSAPKQNNAEITLYNRIGQRLKTYEFNGLKAGDNRLRLEAKGLPAGVYFLKAIIGKHTETQKLIKIR